MPSDIPTEQLESDFSAITARNPVTFTHEGQTSIAGVQTERNITDEESEPGLIEEYDFAIHVLVSLFLTAPAIGDTFSALNARSYRVMQLKISPDGLVAEFQLNTLHK